MIFVCGATHKTKVTDEDQIYYLKQIDDLRTWSQKKLVLQQIVATTSVENVQGHQMRIYLLIWGVRS